MNADQFENALVLGLGRAIIYLLDHDSRPYREIILNACLHHKAYDPQVEGSRAVYLTDLMHASGDQKFYADALVESLKEEGDHWDISQRFQLARMLAQDGNQLAREAMKAAFWASTNLSNEVAAELIELDGIAGLLFVARRIGDSLTQNPIAWEDDYLLSIARDICGSESVEIALKNAAKQDMNVRSYLNAVEKNRALRAPNQKPDPKTLTYERIRSLIEENDAGGVHKWAQTASDTDMMLAAHDLVCETDPTKLRLYLTLFRKRHFPIGLERLFKLVELPDGPIPRHALGVLANLEDERIRSLAFTFVETGSTLRGYAIDLLVHNFRAGDHTTIEGWCDAEQDAGVINAYDRSLRNFFAAHPDPKKEARLLNKLYEREPCAHCRCDVVERLLALGGLSDALRRECEYDSYTDTRSLLKHGASGSEHYGANSPSTMQ
jgi:hypothetical protein